MPSNCRSKIDTITIVMQQSLQNNMPPPKSEMCIVIIKKHDQHNRRPAGYSLIKMSQAVIQETMTAPCFIGYKIMLFGSMDT